MSRNAFSSLAYSEAAYFPRYAPPIDPQTHFIKTGSAVLQAGIPNQRISQHERLVNRYPRMLGIRWLYSRGGQIKPWHRNIMSGGVESSKFQPVTAHTWEGEFNDAIYEAGYPRNLGYTFKVPTIPAPALGNQRDRMMPQPRITRSIFARRAYTSGVKPVPAQGVNRPGWRNR
jgi:hypothetical protein